MPASFVVAKIAQSIDGKVATPKGESKWITSLNARKYARGLRDDFDAIIVGVNTVIKDDPRLTGVTNKSLIAVVLDTRLRISLSAKIISGSRAKQTIVMTTQKASKRKLKFLELRGVKVHIVRLKKSRVDIQSAIDSLVKRGLKKILIEGGATVIGSALNAGCVNQFHIYVAPKIFGDANALDSIVGRKMNTVNHAVRLKNIKIKTIKDNIFIKADVYRNR